MLLPGVCRDMAKEKEHKRCVQFLTDPAAAAMEAKRHSGENAELSMLLDSSPSKAVPEGGGTKRRKTFSNFLRKTKPKKVSCVI